VREECENSRSFIVKRKSATRLEEEAVEKGVREECENSKDFHREEEISSKVRRRSCTLQRLQIATTADLSDCKLQRLHTAHCNNFAAVFCKLP
jgi:hypothetical protein